MNQPLPGIVCTQLFSIPAGGFRSEVDIHRTIRIGLDALFWLLTLGACWSVCTIERVRVGS